MKYKIIIFLGLLFLSIFTYGYSRKWFITLPFALISIIMLIMNYFLIIGFEQ